MKTCRMCGLEKPIDDFHRTKRSRDGRQARCKDCQRMACMETRHRHPETYRLLAVKYRERHPSVATEYRKRWRADNREKHRAHSAISNEKLRENLASPANCESCGHDGKLIAHHDDYSKPLAVKWVCYRCHSEIHGRTV